MMSGKAEIAELLSLSARLGKDPLLIQASSGNTSIKLEGTLWIKASGKWLAHAAEGETLVPVDLARLRGNLLVNPDFAGTGAWVNGTFLRASIETAMHAVLPHRVVIHVHSVNTIAWAVRLDGPERLAERLVGLCWSWIPYVSSGLPLARAIQEAYAENPDTDVFVLANHGLVVCGESCCAAEALLNEVECRVAVPTRPDTGIDFGADGLSRQILHGGFLYPCQAIFLGTPAALMPGPAEEFENAGDAPAFGIVEGRGVVTSPKITASQRCVLNGLLEVVQRIDASAPIRYLSDTEVLALLNEDAHRYQLSAEKNAVQRDRANEQATVGSSNYFR